MRSKNKLKAVDFKVFIIPLIVITVIFFISDIILINSIKNHYYRLLKEESEKYARSYSHSLSKATEADEIINQLLDEKLMMVSKATAMYDGRHSNQLLSELADTLKVDEIYSYNSQGEIAYSNTGKFIGWKAYKGHPVYDFMNGNSISFVEDIRQDTETGIYYKYGYFKASDGCFVQIGVLADKIQNFLGGFEMQHLLNEMQEDGVLAQICFIDNAFNIIGSTDKRLIGKKVLNRDVKAAMIANKEYGFMTNSDSGRVYQVFVPVYFEDKKIGTLCVERSLKDTEQIIKQVTTIGILTLSIVYASLLYTMFSIYKKNKKLIQLVYHDSLTGLPNKQYLQELLAEEIEKNGEDKKALLLVNCRNFGIVNLTFGYEYGDEILKELGEKIQSLVDDNKKVFRFTADRFAMYVKNYHAKKDLISLTHKISEIFYQPFRVKGAKQYLTTQIGIVEIDNKHDKVDRLLKGASIALNHISMNDTLNYAFFNREMETKLQREEMIERELRTAIDENDATKLYLEYQPKVDLKTNQIIGFEALARLKSDYFGLVSPVEFIDIAEKKQLIVPLDNLILKTACEFAASLNRINFSNIKMAVNISGLQLLREDFMNTVMDIVEATGMNASNLELEITESVLLDNFKLINQKLKELQGYKIEIALDDFGTGYSSFYRLRELNVNTLKIDRYFISKVTVRERNELITGDIISMAHKLGLAVVAEGVELHEQKEYLIENGCDIMQGYLFSKPLVEKDAIELLKRNNTIERK